MRTIERVAAVLLLGVAVACHPSGQASGGVSPAPSAEARLAALGISPGTLSPAFTPEQTSYSASLAHDVASVALTATAMDAGAQVQIAGAAPVPSTAQASIGLAVGASPVAVVVTAADGATQQVYNLALTRQPPLAALADLSALVVSAGTLTPPFDAGATDYSVTVETAVTTITVTATTANPQATVTVDAEAVDSGSPSSPMGLSVGTTNISIAVTAADGVTHKAYAIAVTRQPGATIDADLASLTVADAVLSPAFDRDVSSYTAAATNWVSSTTVTPVTSDAQATVTVAGETVTSGHASSALPLTIGNNPFVVVVTARDGVTQKTYNVTVTRPAAAIGTTYYIDPVNGDDDAHNGLATTSAWKSFRNIFSYRGDKTPSYWIQLKPGDLVYVMDGTVSTICRPGDDHGAANVTGLPSIMALRHTTATAAAPIRFMAYPGAHPVLDPQYQGGGIVIYQSSYVEISGLTIHAAYWPEGYGGEGGGIAIEDADHIRIHDVTVYDTDGIDNGNLAGLHCLGCTEIEVYNCDFHDNFDRTAADTGGITTANSTNMVFFGGGNAYVHDCAIYETATADANTNTGACIKYKAASADATAVFEIYNNVFRNCKFFAVASGTGNTHVHHNLVIDGNVGVAIADQANYTREMNEVIEYNTFYGSRYAHNASTAETAFLFNPTLEWNAKGYPGSIANIVFQHNIVYDIGAYSAEHTPVYMNGYVNDTLYNAGISQMHVDDNCYFNAGGNALKFSVAYSASYGALGGVYSWTDWRGLTWTDPNTSQVEALDFDANSINADPAFIAVDTSLAAYDAGSDAFNPAAASPCGAMGAYAGR